MMASKIGTSQEKRLSKQLSWLLRHGVDQEGLKITQEGYVCVADILRHPRYAAHFNLNILQAIVQNDGKQRYNLRQDPTSGEYEIRANQGHSIRSVEAASCMSRIKSETEIPMAVHGTYYRYWPSIRREGLKCMTRNHVHFAVCDDAKMMTSKQISGFRNDCQLLIYLNVLKALDDGIELYKSSNNVVLCAGVDGCVEAKYFLKVKDRRTGQVIDL